jgi:hypothetical protein
MQNGGEKDHVFPEITFLKAYIAAARVQLGQYGERGGFSIEGAIVIAALAAAAITVAAIIAAKVSQRANAIP